MPPTRKRDSAMLYLSSKRESTRSMLGRGIIYEQGWGLVGQRQVRAARFCSSHCRSTSCQSKSIWNQMRCKQMSIISKSSRVEVGLVGRDEVICSWILRLIRRAAQTEKREERALRRSEEETNEDEINGPIFLIEREYGRGSTKAIQILVEHFKFIHVSIIMRSLEIARRSLRCHKILLLSTCPTTRPQCQHCSHSEEFPQR
mmetsp:Transcript_1495/g.4325  ORF Transcript_1495/g.4325 Transcript_1495/m.4325 type:complete len:202 (+) Transcript_1495:85-690(+)